MSGPFMVTIFCCIILCLLRHAYAINTLLIHCNCEEHSMNKNKKNFLICGLTGWCLEILYTSLWSGINHDGRLIGHTSIWMFPIYGTAALIVPVYHKIKRWPAIFRGGVYSLGILSGEFLSGSLLKKFHACPWDYSDARYNIGGVIRLDYMPLWMIAGLIFERILCRRKH